MRANVLVLGWALGLVASTPAAAAADDQCAALRASYRTEVRPKLVRVISRNPGVANLYLKSLNAIKSGKNPTRTEIDRAYRMTLESCGKRDNPANCTSFASEMLQVGRRSYDINRKWVLSGCPGMLTSTQSNEN